MSFILENCQNYINLTFSSYLFNYFTPFLFLKLIFIAFVKREINKFFKKKKARKSIFTGLNTQKGH